MSLTSFVCHVQICASLPRIRGILTPLLTDGNKIEWALGWTSRLRPGSDSYPMGMDFTGLLSNTHLSSLDDLCKVIHN